MAAAQASQIPLQLSRGCVIASIQVDLTEDVITRFQKDLLKYLHATRAIGLVIDVSGVEVIDREDFEALRRTMLMAEVMGAQVALSGLRAGVVSSLIGLGADIDGVHGALNLDEAIDLVNELKAEEEATIADEGLNDLEG